MLSAFSFTESSVAKLSELLKENAKKLVDEQYQEMLVHAGLDELVNVISSKISPLSKHPKATPDAIRRSMHKLDLYLTLEMNAEDRIQDIELQRRVVEREKGRFLDVYREIVDALEDPANLFEVGLVTRSFDQVTILLSTMDDYS